MTLLPSLRVLALLWAASMAAPANLLTNAAFLGLGETPPPGWIFLPAPDGKTTRLGLASPGSLSIRDADPKASVGLGQDVPVVPGRTYVARIAAKGSSLGLYLNWLDENRRLVGAERRKATAETEEFTEISLTETAPPTARFARFWIYSAVAMETEATVKDPFLREGGGASVEETKPLRIPPPDRAFLEKRLLPTHPRLFLTAPELDRIRGNLRDGASAKASWALLVKRADAILPQAVSKYETPDGMRLLATSRQVLNRVLALGLVFRITGDERYKERLWKEVEAAAAFPDWNPRHFLDTAELEHAFALAYDWLWNEWTPERREILAKACLEKGLKPTRGAYRGIGTTSWDEAMKNRTPIISWLTLNNNWNFVCNGGASLAALAFYENDPDLCADVFTNAFASFQKVMDEFEPDGAWYEGPGYWHYSIKYLVPWFRGIETALGNPWNFLEAFPGFAKTPDFPVFLTGTSDQSFNFADAWAGKSPSLPELFWFASRLKNPTWQTFERERMNGTPEELLYYDPAADAIPVGGASLDRHFRGTEVAVFRSGWEKGALWAGLKAGANGINHAHVDLGTFVLDWAGTRFFEDLGAEPQTYVSYKHGFGHDDFYRIRAEGHNTLVIRPDAKAGQEEKAVTRIEDFRSAPESASCRLDLTPAYRKHATSVVRRASLVDGRKAFELSDEIVLRKPSELWWFAHTKAEIALGADGRVATLSRPEADLVVRILEPEGAAFLAMDATPLGTSPNPDVQQKNAGFRKLAIHLTNASRTTLRVQFLPQAPREIRRSMNGLPAGFNPLPGAALRIEAEDFTAQEAGAVEIVEKIGNSGRSIKLWDAKDHSLSYRFRLDRPSECGLLLRYCTAEDSAHRRILVDGKDLGEIFSFPGTGGFSSGSDDWKDVFVTGRKGGLRLKLEAGDHLVTLVNEAGPMNLDWVSLVPLE